MRAWQVTWNADKESWAPRHWIDTYLRGYYIFVRFLISNTAVAILGELHVKRGARTRATKSAVA